MIIKALLLKNVIQCNMMTIVSDFFTDLSLSLSPLLELFLSLSRSLESMAILAIFLDINFSEKIDIKLFENF